MKKKDLQDFKSKEPMAIETAILGKVLDVRRLTAEIGLGRQKNTSLAKLARRDLAQLKTIVREKKKGEI
ncbi:MAG: 50S ribosomal protein L29 [bacterium]|nr:50S ribosomal protein L29 [bacterium]